MRVSILAHGYCGSTLPLAKHLTLAGCDVSCYYLCWAGADQIESINFGRKLKRPTLINKQNTLYAYLPHEVDVHIIPLHNPRSYPSSIKRRMAEALNHIRLHLLARELRERGGLVDVLTYTPYDLYVLRKLHHWGCHVCQTYHEVMQELTQDEGLLPIVAESLRIDCPIIVHSKKTLRDLLAHSTLPQALEGRIRLIHFGPFESFLQYGEGTPVTGLKEGYLLYLGFIKPYKGLSYLYEAVQRIPHDLSLQVVVAGGGHDEALALMRDDERFVVVNRFVDNAELVWLVKNARGIVCPYIAASQSGLVQTAMVYGKPVVATRVGAFPELIEEGRNGFLANPADAAGLAQAIRRFMSATLHHEQINHKELDWNHIAQQYLRLL